MPLMPGMSMAHYPPAVAIDLFYRALLVVGVGVLALFGVLRLAARGARPAEAPARRNPFRERLLYALGALWLLDGFLQAQPGMVTRFIGGLLTPLVQGQPGAVAEVVHLGTQLWGLSPIWFNVGATYIQVLIGIMLLFGRRERTRRIGLWVSIAWGLVVWLVGEGFGGLFVGSGALVGSPGSVLLYALGAVMLLQGEAWWDTGAWRRLIGIGFALYFALMAFLQIWPPDGWWTAGGLGGWALGMAQMPQPAFIAAILSAWAATLQAQPVVWNAVISLSCVGLAALWLVRPGRRSVLYLTVLWTLLVWFLGQDFGVLGGMGTDPNTGAILLAFEFMTWPARRTDVRAWAPELSAERG